MAAKNKPTTAAAAQAQAQGQGPAQSAPAQPRRDASRLPVRPYRLRPGSKFSAKVRGEDGCVVVHRGGTIIYLNEDQASAFADQIDPVTE